jgi:hypothetical protein
MKMALWWSVVLAAGTLEAAGPKVMLVVDEKSLGTIPTAEVEAMAVSLLLERNLPTVDQDMVRANLKREQSLLKSVGDNRGAAALGHQFGADVVIVGEAVAKPSARRIAESNLRTYQAVVTLRAVRTDTSENLGAASEEASIVGLEDVSGSSKALKAAARPALEKILDEIEVRWSGPAADAPARLVLSVGGIDQAWKLKAMRDALRSADFLSGTVQKSYTAGAASFEVESTLPSEEVAEKLLLAPPEGLKLQVLNVAPGQIQLRALERENSP